MYKYFCLYFVNELPTYTLLQSYIIFTTVTNPSLELYSVFHRHANKKKRYAGSLQFQILIEMLSSLEIQMHI